MSHLTFDDPCVAFALHREARSFLQLFPPQQRFPKALCWARFCGPAWLSVLALQTGVGPRQLSRPPSGFLENRFWAMFLIGPRSFCRQDFAEPCGKNIESETSSWSAKLSTRKEPAGRSPGRGNYRPANGVLPCIRRDCSPRPKWSVRFWRNRLSQADLEPAWWTWSRPGGLGPAKSKGFLSAACGWFPMTAEHRSLRDWPPVFAAQNCFVPVAGSRDSLSWFAIGDVAWPHTLVEPPSNSAKPLGKC